ncbi:hypothetical protein AKJ09_02447 [Labilithrix luteola]|uniref:Outer membrane protein beta-barrel domain-containing protein n=1 Tax=Labilithrix luteola TaxID=1391654 RepID=A0A0K1PQI3_9BACT|nr:outer membrane beta-barrel protein [Labilithrix luteola]AKU95783.1 hypothetical protein AKJ09_02447 [Labilithrix luteola]
MNARRLHKVLASSAAGLVASVLLLAAGEREANAAENQHHLGLDPSLALLKVDGKSSMSVGGGLAVHYTYGLSDQFNLMAEVGSAIVGSGKDSPDTPRTSPSTVSHAGVGIGYVIDVIQWVPYIGALGAGYWLAGGTLDNSVYAAGLELAVGLDYQFSRHFAVGVGARQHLIATKLTDYPSYTTIFARVEYAWGF